MVQVYGLIAITLCLGPAQGLVHQAQSKAKQEIIPKQGDLGTNLKQSIELALPGAKNLIEGIQNNVANEGVNFMKKMDSGFEDPRDSEGKEQEKQLEVEKELEKKKPFDGPGAEVWAKHKEEVLKLNASQPKELFREFLKQAPKPQPEETPVVATAEAQPAPWSMDDEVVSGHKLDFKNLEKIFFINLDESADKASNMRKQLKTLDDLNYLERYTAVNRDQARAADLAEFGNGKIAEYLTDKYSDDGVMGTVATHLSHMTLLKKISEHPAKDKVFMIFEDDASFISGADYNRTSHRWHDKPVEVAQDHAGKDIELITWIISTLPKDWQMLKFGFWGKGGCDNGEVDPRIMVCHQKTQDFHSHMGAMGYAVNPDGAKAIIDWVKRQEVHDVDGAMMPVDGEGPITYNTLRSYLWHGRFRSDRVRGDDFQKSLGRFMLTRGDFAESAEIPTWADPSTHVRESSYDAMVRIEKFLDAGGKVDHTSDGAVTLKKQ